MSALSALLLAVSQLSPTPSIEVGPPTSEVHIDREADGSLCVRGQNYKAQFTSQSTTFVPFLGSAAPRNFPIEFTLESARVARRELELEARGEPLHSAGSVTLARTALTERYHVAARSLEQTFTFDALPERGEIVLRLHVASEFAVFDSERELRFENALGHVTYGAAIVFDAAGRRAEVARSFDAGVLELRVPASFVQQATLPLTIDPVIATFALDQSPAIRRNPDVAYDRDLNRFLVCMEEVFSATDSDVLTRFHDVNGALIAGSDAYLDVSSEQWTRPRMANLAQANAYVAVAQRSLPGPAQVVGRVRRVSSLSPKFLASSSATTANLLPDIGGDPFEGAGASFACVVWENQGDIVYRQIDANGTPAGATAATLIAGGQYSAPAISKSNDEADWNVAFECCAPARQIHAARIRWDGVVSTPPFLVELGFADFGSPAVSSSLAGTDKFLVAFSVGIPGTSTGTRYELFDNAAFVTSGTIGGVTTSSRAYATDAHSASSFALVVSEPRPSSGTGFDVNLRELTLAGSTLSTTAGPLDLAVTAGDENAPRVASMHAMEASLLRTFACWSVAGVDAAAALYDTTPSGTITPYCFGDGSGSACPCANSSATGAQAGCLNSFGTAGKLVATGNPSVMFDSVTLTATGLPTTLGQQPTFFQGTLDTNAGQGSAFGDGLRCASGAQIRLGTVSASGGNASFGSGVPGSPLVSVRGAIGQAGATRFYQLSYRNSVVFCTPSTFNLSNGVRIVWVP